MKLQKLLRKDMEPCCTYCSRSTPLGDGERLSCRRCGVVSADFHCRAFHYDPLRRTPPKPAVLRGTFSKADFSLGEADEG